MKKHWVSGVYLVTHNPIESIKFNSYISIFSLRKNYKNLLFHRPLGALGVGGVSRCLILTFLLHLCSTLDNIILDIMRMLDSLTLTLILSAAHLRSLSFTILDKSSATHLHCHVLSGPAVLYETVLSGIE